MDYILCQKGPISKIAPQKTLTMQYYKVALILYPRYVTAGKGENLHLFYILDLVCESCPKKSRDRKKIKCDSREDTSSPKPKVSCLLGWLVGCVGWLVGSRG